jgi:DNA modification methylase
MLDYGSELSDFFLAYKKKRIPIDVDFRRIVPLTSLDRLTHYIHPYPAKLLQNIPIFFLNNSLITGKHSLIFDPFCGSGTVALESLSSGRKCIATDLNPFACLLSRVKCTHIEDAAIDKHLKKILRISKKKRPIEFKIVNRDLWFSKWQYDKLSNLIQSINEIEDEKVRDFFRICFSLAMRKVRNADPRISVPVRINITKYPDDHRLKKYYQGILEAVAATDLYALFSLIVTQNKKRITKIAEFDSKRLHIFERDARKRPLKKHSEKVDLIITSPPYPGAQKYIRACSLSIG